MDRPKKPARNPSHLVFPKAGPVRFVEEQLPRNQESLEFSLGEKFQGAMQAFHETSLVVSADRVEPADLRYTAVNGDHIDVQVVEVVDLRLRQLLRMRTSYVAAIHESPENGLSRYGGCWATLVDSAEPPYLPDPRTVEGQKCLHQLLDHIASVGESLGSLDVGRIRSRKTLVGSTGRSVALIVERLAPSSASTQFTLQWTGGGPPYRSDVSRGYLTAAVRSKIAKHYAKPASAQFWLLAYSIDVLLAKEDPDLLECRALLSTEDHPFDKVWYLYPYAAQKLGHLLSVWQRADG